MTKTGFPSSGHEVADLLRDIFGRRGTQRFGSVEELFLDLCGGRPSAGTETIWPHLEPNRG